MNNKKNIDRLFQEKFKDFEIAPKDAVWDRINESLPNKKKKRRVIALWWQIGGVAALIALLLTVGVSVFNSDEKNNSNLPVVNSDENDTEKHQVEEQLQTTPNSKQDELSNASDATKMVGSKKNQESMLEESQGNSNENGNASDALITSKKYQQNSNTVAHQSKTLEKTTASEKRSYTKNQSHKATDNKVASNARLSQSQESHPNQIERGSESQSVIKNAIEDTKIALAHQEKSNATESSNSENAKQSSTKPENAIIEDPNKQSIENAIAESTNTINEKEKEKQNRWSIAPNVAPVYYSSLGEGSSIDRQFDENAKSGAINMSYGIIGSYAISKKIKVRAGINQVNLSQTTADVFAFTGADNAARGIDAQFGNISFKNGDHSVSLMSSDMLNRSSTPEIFDTKIAGNIDQQFGFIEVPLELEYRLLDSKFGVNVIGGFSTFFLNENEIYADVNGVSTLIGEANNISNTSFSANFGLGMDYSLSKQWNINLEPTFKYQINTFNNTSGNIRPFFVGVYTGLSFKF